MYNVYSLPYENLSFGVAIVDSALVIKHINSNFSSILQRESSDLLDKKISSFIPEIYTTYFKYKQYGIKKISLANGQTLVFDIIKISEKPQTEFLIFCQDFTEHKQISEQYSRLNEQLQMYTQMFDKFYDGIFITDSNGVTLYVNDSFLALSGGQRQDIVGKSVYELMENGLVPNSCLSIVIRTKEPASTINNYPKGKSCLVSGTPIFTDGKLSRAIGVVRDLTELQSLQNQLANVTSLNLSYKHKLKEIQTKTSNINLIETRNKTMQNIYDKVIKIANVDSPILLTGETGVGKDHLANFIHEVSERNKTGVMIKINCGAIPDNLMESELFGYEKGAFTGANKEGKAGLFELASNGTLYLDEIGDMPLHLQVKLLSCIQNKQFFRIGGTKVVKLQSRIIAATNVNLEKLIAKRMFRLDLYYRLNTISIQIPPLRDRQEDILPIAINFLNEFNQKYNKSCYFSPKTMGLLLKYSWPGNIREMRNIIERVIIMSEQNSLEPSCFEEIALNNLNNYYDLDNHNFQLHGNTDDLSLKSKIELYEANCIREALDKYTTLKEAADSLGISLSTLVRKNLKYKLSKKFIETIN